MFMRVQVLYDVVSVVFWSGLRDYFPKKPGKSEVKLSDYCQIIRTQKV